LNGTITKPTPKDDRAKKEKWIRAKYDKKDFISKKTPVDKAELPLVPWNVLCN
jgi:hypothetical protein